MFLVDNWYTKETDQKYMDAALDKGIDFGHSIWSSGFPT